MKLILVDSDNVVLDETEFTREEWDEAVMAPFAAAGLIRSLQAGKDAR